MTNHSTSDPLIATSLFSDPENPQSDMSSSVAKPQKTPRKKPLRIKKQPVLVKEDVASSKTEQHYAIDQWRKKDNRIWSDEEVREFPHTFFYNLHQKEWEIKTQMAKAIQNYLFHEAKSVYSILDVGCGCGWLGNILSNFTKGSILGLDQDAGQIEQATRIFAKENLAFRTGDFYQTRLRKNSFDYIILIDAHQWLGSVEEITARATSLLTPGGELHILSSSLPAKRTIPKQQEAFTQYCADKLMPSVPQYFHWSSKEDFLANGFEELNTPSLLSKLFRKQKAGTWMRLYSGKK